MAEEGVCVTCAEPCSVDASHCEECRIEEIYDGDSGFGIYLGN